MCFAAADFNIDHLLGRGSFNLFVGLAREHIGDQGEESETGDAIKNAMLNRYRINFESSVRQCHQILETMDPQQLWNEIISKEQLLNEVTGDLHRTKFKEFRSSGSIQYKALGTILLGAGLFEGGDEYIQAYSFIVAFLLRHMSIGNACSTYLTLVKSDLFKDKLSTSDGNVNLAISFSNALQSNNPEMSDIINTYVYAKDAVWFGWMQTIMMKNIPDDKSFIIEEIFKSFIQNGGNDVALFAQMMAILKLIQSQVESIALNLGNGQEDHDQLIFQFLNTEWPSIFDNELTFKSDYRYAVENALQFLTSEVDPSEEFQLIDLNSVPLVSSEEYQLQQQPQRCRIAKSADSIVKYVSVLSSLHTGRVLRPALRLSLRFRMADRAIDEMEEDEDGYMIVPDNLPAELTFTSNDQCADVENYCDRMRKKIINVFVAVNAFHPQHASTRHGYHPIVSGDSYRSLNNDNGIPIDKHY